MPDDYRLLQLNLQFFAKEGAGGEKTEPATEKKLSDARKEGQVAKSRELGQSLTLLGLFIILKIWAGSMGHDFMNAFFIKCIGICHHSVRIDIYGIFPPRANHVHIEVVAKGTTVGLPTIEASPEGLLRRCLAIYRRGIRRIVDSVGTSGKHRHCHYGKEL